MAGKEDQGKQQGGQSSHQGSQSSHQGSQWNQSTQGTQGSQGSRGSQGGQSTQGTQGGQSTQQFKDPVCGMNVQQGKHTETSNYQGQNYHFCSSECKEKFDRSPQQFAKRTA